MWNGKSNNETGSKRTEYGYRNTSVPDETRPITNRICRQERKVQPECILHIQRVAGYL